MTTSTIKLFLEWMSGLYFPCKWQLIWIWQLKWHLRLTPWSCTSPVSQVPLPVSVIEVLDERVSVCECVLNLLQGFEWVKALLKLGGTPERQIVSFCLAAASNIKGVVVNLFRLWTLQKVFSTLHWVFILFLSSLYLCHLGASSGRSTQACGSIRKEKREVLVNVAKQGRMCWALHLGKCSDVTTLRIVMAICIHPSSRPSILTFHPSISSNIHSSSCSIVPLIHQIFHRSIHPSILTFHPSVSSISFIHQFHTSVSYIHPFSIP